MNYTLLTKKEMDSTYVGAALTVTAVMSIICIAIMAVVIYRLFRSQKGGVTVPGGWKFSWA